MSYCVYFELLYAQPVSTIDTLLQQQRPLLLPRLSARPDLTWHQQQHRQPPQSPHQPEPLSTHQ